MRKKRELETPLQRTRREEKEEQGRIDKTSAQDRAMDDAVRQSIERHGA